MNKKLLILSILLIILVVGCGQKEVETDLKPLEDNKDVLEDKPVSDVFAGSLSQALKLGRSMKCDVQSAGGSSIITVKGSNYKQEVTNQGISVTTITKEEENKLCVYSTTNIQGQSQCTKSCVEKVSGASGGESNINVLCTPAVVSDSAFVTPANCKDLYEGAPTNEFDTPQEGVDY